MTVFPNLFCQEPTSTTMLLQKENKTIQLTQRPLGVSHADKMEKFRLCRVLLNFFLFQKSDFSCSQVTKTLQKAQKLHMDYTPWPTMHFWQFLRINKSQLVIYHRSFEIDLKWHFFIIFFFLISIHAFVKVSDIKCYILFFFVWTYIFWCAVIGVKSRILSWDQWAECVMFTFAHMPLGKS